MVLAARVRHPLWLSTRELLQGRHHLVVGVDERDGSAKPMMPRTVYRCFRAIGKPASGLNRQAVAVPNRPG